ncbi:MAG: dGTPase [Planctomycetota bacterium]|jgi:dGTPase
MSLISLHDRRTKEAWEDEHLSAYALRSSGSAGRAHHEEEDDLRTCWERDRDRIVHSTAFRRLMHKTQVFVATRSDHNRTRLSHSLEVSQVARSMGSALSLNEPLCETLALVHDIGHPPYGHRGETALNLLMKEFGGFRHNSQVLRVVDRLERRSPDYPGLNLTREVRESLLKHETDADWPAEFAPRPKLPYLEAQVVDLADSTAYDVHDLEDGLRNSMFSEAEVFESCSLWQGAHESVDLRHPGFLKGTRDDKLRIKRITNEVLKICINDLIDTSARRIAEARLDDHNSARQADRRLVAHSEQLAPEVAELQSFLYKRFYQHKELKEFGDRSTEIIGVLFQALVTRPEELPIWFRGWIEKAGLERSVCDYIAGMTDRFAESECARLTAR